MPAVQDEPALGAASEGGVHRTLSSGCVPALSALFSRPRPERRRHPQGARTQFRRCIAADSIVERSGFQCCATRAFRCRDCPAGAAAGVALLRNDGHSGSHRCRPKPAWVLAANDSHVLLAERHHPPRQVPLESFVAASPGKVLSSPDSGSRSRGPDAISATAAATGSSASAGSFRSS